MRERCLGLADDLRKIVRQEKGTYLALGGLDQRAWFFLHVAEVLTKLVEWGLV